MLLHKEKYNIQVSNKKKCFLFLVFFNVEAAPVLEHDSLFSDSERTMNIQGGQPESTCLVATATVSIFSVSNVCDTVSVLSIGKHS